MKKIVYPLLGAVLAGLVCNALFWGIGQIAMQLDIRLYNSEQEASRNFAIFLFAFAFSVVLGAVAGHLFAKKSS